MTDDEIRAAKARAEASTTGPWLSRGGMVIVEAEQASDAMKKNSVFIAAARTDVPALCNALLEARDVVRALVYRIDAPHDDGCISRGGGDCDCCLDALLRRARDVAP